MTKGKTDCIGRLEKLYSIVLCKFSKHLCIGFNKDSLGISFKTGFSVTYFWRTSSIINKFLSLFAPPNLAAVYGRLLLISLNLLLEP